MRDFSGRKLVLDDAFRLSRAKIDNYARNGEALPWGREMTAAVFAFLNCPNSRRGRKSFLRIHGFSAIESEIW